MWQPEQACRQETVKFLIILESIRIDCLRLLQSLESITGVCYSKCWLVSESRETMPLCSRQIREVPKPYASCQSMCSRHVATTLDMFCTIRVIEPVHQWLEEGPSVSLSFLCDLVLLLTWAAPQFLNAMPSFDKVYSIFLFQAILCMLVKTIGVSHR